MSRERREVVPKFLFFSLILAAIIIIILTIIPFVEAKSLGVRLNFFVIFSDLIGYYFGSTQHGLSFALTEKYLSFRIGVILVIFSFVLLITLIIISFVRLKHQSILFATTRMLTALFFMFSLIACILIVCVICDVNVFNALILNGDEVVHLDSFLPIEFVACALYSYIAIKFKWVILSE